MIAATVGAWGRYGVRSPLMSFTISPILATASTLGAKAVPTDAALALRSSRYPWTFASTSAGAYGDRDGKMPLNPFTISSTSARSWSWVLPWQDAAIPATTASISDRAATRRVIRLLIKRSPKITDDSNQDLPSALS